MEYVTTQLAWNGELPLRDFAVQPAIATLLSKNSTVPVGVPEGVGVTVAVYVTC
jgi:hypothetical protein